MTVTVDQIWFLAVGLAVVVGLPILLLRLAKANAARLRRMQGESQQQMEALFRASFPELQPHFHPKDVYAYAKARQARKASTGPFRWRNPPGFPLASVADIAFDGLKDNVRLLDAADAVLASFVFEEHPEGAVLRVGKGKLTVGLKGPEPRVRYWHPEREFKWTPTSWRMKSGVSDQPLESASRDHDTWSDASSSHSSSRSSAATAAAAGAGIVAAGGSFDGGGASAHWDEGGGSSSSSSSSDSSPDFSSVESGSSSTSSSTTY